MARRWELGFEAPQTSALEAFGRSGLDGHCLRETVNAAGGPERTATLRTNYSNSETASGSPCLLSFVFWNVTVRKAARVPSGSICPPLGSL